MESRMHQVRLRVARVSAAGWWVAPVLLGAALDATLGLSEIGWVALILTGSVVALVLSGRERLGPADHITALRAVLAAGVAALVADGFVGREHTATLVALAAV